MGMYIDVWWINEAYFNSKPCGTIFHCMQGTTHRSSSLNDTATSSPVSLQEAATQKVKVIRAFWIHNTSRSHDHSTPRSFLLVATTTSMQQSLSNRMRQLLGFFPTAFNYTFSYLFHVSHFTRFTQFLWASHVHPSPIHDCRLPTQSNDIRKAFSSFLASAKWQHHWPPASPVKIWTCWRLSWERINRERGCGGHKASSSVCWLLPWEPRSELVRSWLKERTK